MNRRQLLTGSLLALGCAGRASMPAAAAAKGPARRRVRVGQIGTGHAHAAGKMEALRRLADDFEVVGVVEPDSALRQRAQASPAYRGLPWLSEEQLLGTPGLDAVAIETRVQDLVPAALRAMAVPVHLHLDKPAGESMAAYQELLERATREEKHVQMGFMFRHNPAFRFCFEAVRQGWLGDVFELHGVISSGYNQTAREPLLPYRGGTMFELGCHLIDAMVTVLGKPQRVTSFGRRSHPEWDRLLDNQLAVCEYPQATATIRSSLMEQGARERRQFVVVGDRGTLEIRPLEPPSVSLTLAAPQGGFARGTHNVPLPAMPGRYEDQLIELARIVRGEKTPEYTTEHDLAVHATVLAAAGVQAADPAVPKS